MRLLLEDILTDVGHEVETASNGSKGVEIFKENSFDMVFLQDRTEDKFLSNAL